MEAFIQNPILTFYAPFAWEQPSLSEKQDEYLKSHYVAYPYGQTTTIAQIQTNTIETSALSANINLSPTLLSPLTPLYTPANLNMFPANGTTVSANGANVIGRVICNRGGNTYLSGIRTLASLSLTKGTWFLTGEWSTDSQGINNSMGGIAFNTTTSTLVGSFGGKQSIRLFAQPAPSQPMATSAVISLNATTTVFLIGQTDNNGYFTKNQYLTAVRIA
jgi:hypothetical protein